jgi:hypothetical protein
VVTDAPLDERRLLPHQRPYDERRYFLGIDLAQSLDFTALVLVEARQHMRVGGFRSGHKPYGPPEYWVTDALKLAKMTPYPVQSRIIDERARREVMVKAGEVIMDRSGVGRPIYDLLKEAKTPNLCGVTITPGEGEPQREGGYDWRAPKIRIVQALDVCINDGSLKISEEMPLAEELRHQIESYQATYSGRGTLMFDAAGTGHDDLVMALALALWAATKRRGSGVFSSSRPFGQVHVKGMW